MSSDTLPLVLDTSLHILELKTRRKESVLHELVRWGHGAGIVVEPALLLDTLALRERVGSSALGKGVALPNARSIAVPEPRLVLARSRRGVEWGAADGPVHLVLLALSPALAAEDEHQDFVARVAALGRLQRHRQRLLENGDPAAIAASVREACG